MSGKDLTHFADQWIARNGITSFNCSFSYIRKKNLVELRMVQDPPKGYQKFIVSTVHVKVHFVHVADM